MDYFLGLAVGMCALTVAGSAGVVVWYYRAWRTAPATHKRLPLHVWMVASAHVMYSVGAIVGLLRGSLNVRVVLFLTGASLTLAALYVIARRGAERHEMGRYVPSLSGPLGVTVYEARQPHEVYIAVMCMIGGLAIVVSGIEPGSVASVLPETMVYVWAAVLTFGGATVVIGVVWGDRITGALIERAGLAPLALASAVYSLCVVVFGGPAAALPALIVLGFAMACFARGRQINRWLATLQMTPAGSER